MSTTIELDEALVQQTLKETGAESEQAAVEEALRLFLRLKAQSEILALRGKAKWEGNLEESRLSRFAE